jgi:hypothetical protein
MKSIFESLDVDCIQIEAETALGLSEQGRRPGTFPEEYPEENILFGVKWSNISFIILDQTKCTLFSC